ncbi:MAG: hypothetical protein JSW07_20285 [bacterium]|nr:MAG: hypothetical protein JSW07_20285 [bacterium]
MAFDDIIKRIQKDAKKEANEIEQAAREQAEQILAEAQKKADQLHQELRAKAEQRAAQEESRIITLANLELRKQLLQERQNHIDVVFKRAFDSLANLKDQEYKNFIKNLLSSVIETGEEVVIPPADGRFELTKQVIDDLNKEKKLKLKLADEKKNIEAGFILQRGKQEINCSLKAIINNLRDGLEPEVAQILFQES